MSRSIVRAEATRMPNPIRPIVAICAAIERARWGSWEAPTLLSPLSYTRAFQAAGALVIVLPPDDRAVESPDELLSLVDGLVLAGGSDIDPRTYGDDPHPQTVGTNPARDKFEVSLAKSALERDLPVLGICRGMQILNIATGGTLLQHLPDVVDHDEHRGAPGTFSTHTVQLKDGSRLRRITGRASLEVKSLHHQALADLGTGVEPTAWAAADRLIEAIELGGRFAVGVLWHPEEDAADELIQEFVHHARAHGLEARASVGSRDATGHAQHAR
jgi:putative glutamine amidotransferase